MGLQRLAGMHARVFAADITGQFQDQAHGQGRGRVAAPLRAAQRHLVVLGGFHIDRGIAHARGDQEFQFGQACEHRARERGAFAHRADDLEILQGVGGGFRGRKRLVEHRDVDAVGDFGPVGDRKRHIEIVVEDCTAQPRHGGGPLMARMTAGWPSGKVAIVARNQWRRKRTNSVFERSGNRFA